MDSSVQSTVLACCLKREHAEILQREFRKRGSTKLVFSPSWESTRLYLAGNHVQQIIVPAEICEELLRDLSALSGAGTAIIVLGERGTAQKLVRGTSGKLFRKRDPYEFIERKIRTLGADMRNDLNNPLQEIVALLYVAKSAQPRNDDIEPVFEALDRAAFKINSVVSGLEKRICDRVLG